MGRKKKIVNNSVYPDHLIESLARCLLPDIIACYESEEGQRAFAQWQAEQGAQKVAEKPKES